MVTILVYKYDNSLLESYKCNAVEVTPRVINMFGVSCGGNFIERGYLNIPTDGRVVIT